MSQFVKKQISAKFGALCARGVSMKNAVKGAVLTGSLAVAGAANAAIPAAVKTQLDAVKTDGLAMADLVWPVVITLFGALVLFKLFKRFGSQI